MIGIEINWIDEFKAIYALKKGRSIIQAMLTIILFPLILITIAMNFINKFVFAEEIDDFEARRERLANSREGARWAAYGRQGTGNIIYSQNRDIEEMASVMNRLNPESEYPMSEEEQARMRYIGGAEQNERIRQEARMADAREASIERARVMAEVMVQRNIPMAFNELDPEYLQTIVDRES